MKIIYSFFLMILLFFISAFSQTATKVDYFPYIQCGDFFHRIQTLYQDEIKNKPQNKIVIIYYEGKREFSKYDDKSKKYETVIENPKFGNALNRAKEIPLYLKMVHKVSSNKFVLIDGGYRRFFELELWSMPQGTEIPEATPTLNAKILSLQEESPNLLEEWLVVTINVEILDLF